MKKQLSVFFKLLFVAFAFAMFPVRSAAQLYVVDNNFPDSIEAYVIQTAKDTGKAYRGNTAFKLAFGRHRAGKRAYGVRLSVCRDPERRQYLLHV